MSSATNTPSYTGVNLYGTDFESRTSTNSSPNMSTILGSSIPGLDASAAIAPLVDYNSVYSGSSSTIDLTSQAKQQHRRLTATSFAERPGSVTTTSDAASPKPQRRRGSEKEEQENNSAQDAADKSEATAPSWTEMKTKAGKERKRLPLACIACRRKKIRCSGEHPACKHCLRSRIPCVYKVTARKAAPRTDYMAMLDKRLKRMEERVIKIIPKEEQGIVASTGRATVKPPMVPVPVSKKRAAEQSIDDLEVWSKANTQQQDDVYKTAFRSGQMRSHDVDEQNLLLEGADKLPSQELQEHLAEVFFDFVYGQSYHLLHKPSFMRRLAQGEIAPVLSLAVCAMAARFSEHPAVRVEPAFLRGEDWAAAAREISLRRFDSPNITILIVYLILTLHEFGTCQGSRSWMFAGMAQRMAYAMQLHHDLPYDPCTQHSSAKGQLSHTDREIRRRTMWACFMTDRYCSSGSDRPTFISVEHLRTQLPIQENYFQMELTGPTETLAGKVVPSTNNISCGGELEKVQDNMGVAAYMIRMVAIWGDCINYYNMGGKAKEQYPMWDERSKFDQLRKAIRSWHNTLPDRLRYRPDNLATHGSEKIANQFIFMHIIYQQTSLFINRFALPLAAAQPTATKGIPTSFIQESAKAALDAANSISSLVHEGMSYNVVAPFAGYSAFFSSTVHIQGAFSKNAALVASSNKNLTSNINYLTKMKKHWGMFHFMTENLRDLYRKHVDASRHSEHADKANGERIFQYGDWFDRYPHGVSRADYHESTSNVKQEPGADAGLGQQSNLQTFEQFFSSSKQSPPIVQPPAARSQKPRKSAKKNAASEEKSPTSAPAQQATANQRQLSLQLQAQQHATELYNQLGSEADMATMSMYNTGFDQTQQGVYSSTMEDSYLPGSAEAFVGYDTNAALSFPMPGMPFDPMGMNQYTGTGVMPDQSNGQGLYHAAASGGWFMPMNMDAAALAEASGPYSTGSIDWSTQFDMASLQPNALTSRTQMELDNQDRPGMGTG